jgi:hypothetical protein
VALERGRERAVEHELAGHGRRERGLAQRDRGVRDAHALHGIGVLG